MMKRRYEEDGLGDEDELADEEEDSDDVGPGEAPARSAKAVAGDSGDEEGSEEDEASDEESGGEASSSGYDSEEEDRIRKEVLLPDCIPPYCPGLPIPSRPLSPSLPEERPWQSWILHLLCVALPRRTLS